MLTNKKRTLEDKKENTEKHKIRLDREVIRLKENPLDNDIAKTESETKTIEENINTSQEEIIKDIIHILKIETSETPAALLENDTTELLGLKSNMKEYSKLRKKILGTEMEWDENNKKESDITTLVQFICALCNLGVVIYTQDDIDDDEEVKTDGEGRWYIPYSSYYILEIPQSETNSQRLIEIADVENCNLLYCSNITERTLIFVAGFINGLFGGIMTSQSYARIGILKGKDIVSRGDAPTFLHRKI